MQNTTHFSRLDRLTEELVVRGMAPVAAEDFSCQLILHYPLASRLGVERLSAEICNRGVRSESAREAAVALLATELFDRGMAFDALLQQLEDLEMSSGEALAGALEGSRIVRQTRGLGPAPSMLSNVAWIGFASLCIATVGLALLLRLGI